MVQALCLLWQQLCQGVYGESMRVNLPPSVQLLEVDEEGLLQLSVPAELAQKVLQEVEKRCQGSTRCDLCGSHVYTKYLLGRGAEQDGAGSTAMSSEGAVSGSLVPEATAAKAAENLSAAQESLCAAAGPRRAPAAAAKSDAQLFGELLEREGLLLPEVTEEPSRGNQLPGAGAHAGWQRWLCSLGGGRAWAGHGVGRCPEAAWGGSVGAWQPGRCWRCRCCAEPCAFASLPPVLGSCKGVSERSSLAQVAALVGMVQSRSSEAGLCLDGLKDMLKLLEEPEQQAGGVQDVLVTRSVG